LIRSDAEIKSFMRTVEQVKKSTAQRKAEQFGLCDTNLVSDDMRSPGTGKTPGSVRLGSQSSPARTLSPNPAEMFKQINKRKAFDSKRDKALEESMK
jgi:hypothetical protein